MKAAFESIPSVETSSIVAYWRREAQFAFNWHYHPEMELTYIHQGQGRRLVGDQLSEFGPGDLVLLGPDLPHTWATQQTAENDGGSPAAAVVIQFPELLFTSDLSGRPEFDQIRRLLRQAGRGVAFPKDVALFIGTQMMELVEYSGLEKLTRFFLILDQLSRATLPAALASPLYIPSLKSGTEERLDRVFQLVHREFTRPLPLEEMAALVHMTPSSFSRFFKRMTGISFSDYLNDLRVARACQLLTETQLPISQIAFAAGFNSTTHFNRTFLQKKGRSPRAYRKR